ncbi:MAG: hypothetical protein E6J86_06510 [Deltaproteobacteria bacterium]|nr:MAG: hypothetical protein E6J86_06510 [Deltaproteobacteria bacterium]
MAHRAFVMLLLLGAAARAETNFGSRGQVVPFGTVSYAHASVSGGGSSDLLTFAPGAFWFPTNSLAIGGSVLYQYQHNSAFGGFGVHSVGFEPAVGFGIPLAERIAFFPRMGMAFSWQFPSPGNSTHRIFIDGYAPVLFIPVPHFYIGLGPALAVDVASSFAKQTQVGFTTEIGGYF